MMISKPARILTISDDEGLLLSREMVLRSEGYEVASHTSRDFLDLVHLDAFDVAILCQSVEASRAQRVTEHLLKLAPHLPLVRIDSLAFKIQDGGATEFELMGGPRALLHVVGTILQNQPLRERLQSSRCSQQFS